MTGAGQSGHRARHARAALFAALAAMILRALLPSGLMIEPGTGTIVLCTGKGLVERPADLPGKPAKAVDGLCAFAAQAKAAAPPASLTPSLIAFPVYAEVVPGKLKTIIPGRGLAAPPPPSQAPPTLI